MLYLSISPRRDFSVDCLLPVLPAAPTACGGHGRGIRMTGAFPFQMSHRACLEPRQAQGALSAGTAGFPEIAKNSPTRHSLIHRLHLRLTHSLLQRFFHSNFNYIMDSLFSALIYSLPAVCVYHVSNQAGSPPRACGKFSGLWK